MSASKNFSDKTCTPQTVYFDNMELAITCSNQITYQVEKRKLLIINNSNLLNTASIDSKLIPSGKTTP